MKMRKIQNKLFEFDPSKTCERRDVLVCIVAAETY